MVSRYRTYILVQADTRKHPSSAKPRRIAFNPGQTHRLGDPLLWALEKVVLGAAGNEAGFAVVLRAEVKGTPRTILQPCVASPFENCEAQLPAAEEGINSGGKAARRKQGKVSCDFSSPSLGFPDPDSQKARCFLLPIVALNFFSLSEFLSV